MICLVIRLQNLDISAGYLALINTVKMFQFTSF